MNICDLEFIDDSVSADNRLILRGGAAVTAASDVYTTGSGVYANASAVASGDYSAVSAVSGAVFVTDKPYYPVGYGLGYGAGYGVEVYHTTIATDYSTSIDIV